MPHQRLVLNLKVNGIGDGIIVVDRGRRLSKKGDNVSKATKNRFLGKPGLYVQCESIGKEV